MVGHVYVADHASAKIFEFPLVHGVASSTTDRILNVALVGTTDRAIDGNIAIDADGNLAVPVGSVEAGQVDFYAPGAKGNAAPSRTLSLQSIPGGVAFDAQSRIYLNIDGLSIYAAGASGSDNPIATFPNVAANIAMALSGTTLYGAGYQSITSYANAGTSPSPMFSYCLPSSSKLYNGEIAVDGANSRFFVTRYLPSSDNGGKITIYSTQKGGCPRQSARSITVRPTANGKFMPLGVALLGDSLFVTDYANLATYQLSALRGVQAPIATMRGPSSPISVTVGP